MSCTKSLLCVLAMMIGLVGASFLASVSAGPVTSSAADQPYMQAALADLEKAQTELQQAKANKGGHRMAALGYVQDAIKDVSDGINYDRTHENASVFSDGGRFISVAAVSSAADQPRMRAALGYLQSARSNLQKASADKGGYRVKALEKIDKAISEVNQGMAFAG